MPNPDPFFAAADRIAYDLHTKLWRFVYEFRATKALSSPRTSSSMYWYESETGPDQFCSDTLSDTSSPSHFFLPHYRSISQNGGFQHEPMIVEVILRLPRLSNGTKDGSLGLISSQIPESIILETWKLSLTGGQSDGLMENTRVHRLVKMYEERRRFCWAIRICINKLPSAKFIRQVHGSQTLRSPDGLALGFEIVLRLRSGLTSDIERQFVPCGLDPLPIRIYTFPPISHLYGNFVLSAACISDSTRLISALSLWYPEYWPMFGINLSPETLETNEQKVIPLKNFHKRIEKTQAFLPKVSDKQAERPKAFPSQISYKEAEKPKVFPPQISDKEAERPKSLINSPVDQLQKKRMENPRAKLASEKFLPPSGISRLLRSRGNLAKQKENLLAASCKRDVILDMALAHPPFAGPSFTSRDRPGSMQSKNLNLSANCILPSSVESFNDPKLSLFNADPLNTNSKFLLPDNPPSPPNTPRFGIPIPPKKIRLRDDYPNAQWWLKHMLHENLRSRRRVINSASTAGSRPSPMISGASDPITPEIH